MKRIIRLTESDLARIVKRVIKEQEETNVQNIEKEIEDADENNPSTNVMKYLKNMNVNSISSERLRRKAERMREINKRKFEKNNQ